MSPEEILTAVERSARSYFESEPARASISFLGVEPVEVLRFDDLPTRVDYLTLGMARRPMTGADEGLLEQHGRRAELLIAANRDGGDLWRQLAVLGAAPAVEGLVYDIGATVDLNQPLAAGSRCTGAIVVAAPLSTLQFEEDSVEFLQLLPATGTELAWARVHGAEALGRLWQEQKTDLLDLTRRSVQLPG